MVLGACVCAQHAVAVRGLHFELLSRSQNLSFDLVRPWWPVELLMVDHSAVPCLRPLRGEKPVAELFLPVGDLTEGKVAWMQPILDGEIISNHFFTAKASGS